MLLLYSNSCFLRLREKLYTVSELFYCNLLILLLLFLTLFLSQNVLVIFKNSFIHCFSQFLIKIQWFRFDIEIVIQPHLFVCFLHDNAIYDAPRFLYILESAMFVEMSLSQVVPLVLKRYQRREFYRLQTHILLPREFRNPHKVNALRR